MALAKALLVKRLKSKGLKPQLVNVKADRRLREMIIFFSRFIINSSADNSDL
jgi:hypothetical protein